MKKVSSSAGQSFADGTVVKNIESVQGFQMTQGNDSFRDYGDYDDFVLGWGGAGRDVLLGSGGSDVLFGEKGNDRLNGGAGNDVLTGGTGRDVFVFAAGQDRITDFTDNRDTIELDGAALGLSGLTVADVLTMATVIDGNTQITFATGDTLVIEGLSNIGALTDDLTIL